MYICSWFLGDGLEHLLHQQLRLPEALVVPRLICVYTSMCIYIYIYIHTCI